MENLFLTIEQDVIFGLDILKSCGVIKSFEKVEWNHGYKNMLLKYRHFDVNFGDHSDKLSHPEAWDLIKNFVPSFQQQLQNPNEN